MKKLLLFLSLLSASALCRADSFNITNTLAGGVSIISFPTNTPLYVTNSTSSNFVNQSTGGAVFVGNNTFADLNFQCFPTFNAATGTCQVTLQLIRSIAGNPPAVTINTNTGQIMTNDWETFQQPYLSFTIPVTGTNAVNWHTNLLEFAIGGAQWIGVYSLTNATTNGIICSNCAAYLNKKIIPIRYP